ncbi:cell division protein ZapA [Desulfuromusa kysingii]|uniref:Cell division protein ZapA n=1 Tax=Desulfuromusa kysingii TaxID=37625 RepID=A0A1H3WSY8_9BACT|nr:cell division protein ZapA [Desulfuromusa kysingii]SDZ89464.1 cell division protein ZapA [Desulfuromusa kysingii]
MSPNVKVTILGREYKLRSQESEAQIQRVVTFIEDKLAETASGRSVDTRDLTVLTLLNLAGQYLQLVDQEIQDREQKEKRLHQLIEVLEHAVADNSGC